MLVMSLVVGKGLLQLTYQPLGQRLDLFDYLKAWKPT